MNCTILKNLAPSYCGTYTKLFKMAAMAKRPVNFFITFTSMACKSCRAQKETFSLLKLTPMKNELDTLLDK